MLVLVIPGGGAFPDLGRKEASLTGGGVFRYSSVALRLTAVLPVREWRHQWKPTVI